MTLSRLFVAIVLSLGVSGSTGWAQTQKPPARPAAGAKPKPTPAAKPAPPVVAPAPPAPAPAPPSDVKVVTAYTQGPQVSQNTSYIRGPRQRVEFPGMVSLDQCDLKRTVLLSPATRKYRVQAYISPASPPASSTTQDEGAADPNTAAFSAMMAGQGMGTPAARGGVVTTTTTFIDTLERQQMFGLEARRIKTVMVRQPSKEACDSTSVRTEVDAWYVDLPGSRVACSRSASSPTAAAPPPTEGCQDRQESQVVGDVTLGFPLKTVTTTVTGAGERQQTSSVVSEVTALEITHLDAALFDVPADFVEAKSLLELTPSVAAGGTLADALFGSVADGTSQVVPKRPGVIRIGVLEPVNKSARTTLQMRAVRQELVTRLNKAPYEAVPLNGSTPQSVSADMARLQSDLVLVAEVVEVKTSKPGRMGGMLKAASGGGPPKDKHEVKMVYKIYPADATATVKAQGEVKADSGGGFGLGSALRVAAFAGQMYMGGAGGLSMMRGFGAGGLGMGMAMINPMQGMMMSGGFGAMGGGGFYDPRAMAMTSMLSGLGGGGLGGMSAPGMPSFDASDQEIFQVTSEATESLAKHAIEALKKSK